jgi:hypothetical protein
MTEAEWLACTDPKPMLVFLRHKKIDGKLRLFALACCQRIDEHITDPRCRAAVQYAEEIAEGGTRGWRGRPPVAKGVKLACQQVDGQTYVDLPPGAYSRQFVKINAAHAARGVIDTSPYLAALFASGFAANVVGWASGHAEALGALPPMYAEAQRGEKVTQACLLRDVVGPFPFRSVAADPAWLWWNDSAVANMAAAIYQDRAFDRLPILADALEDAGCDNAEILAHCRGAGDHVRGCWVVDLLMEKE